MTPAKETGEEILKLLAVLPLDIQTALKESSDLPMLVEVVLDLGKPAEARFAKRSMYIKGTINQGDIDFVTARIGQFSGDNRAGIERTLHRISAIRNRQGKIIGLTCRVGRAIYGTNDIIQDVIESGKNILFMGPPGIGKTTKLREASRILSDEFNKRVIVIDTTQRDRRRRRHPSSGHRQSQAHAGRGARAPAQSDDRGGGEPHARGHHRRRDRDRGRSGGLPHDRRARRPADRHRARQSRWITLSATRRSPTWSAASSR